MRKIIFGLKFLFLFTISVSGWPEHARLPMVITHFGKSLGNRKDFDSRVCRSCWRRGALLPRETPDRCQGLALGTSNSLVALKSSGEKTAISSSLDDGVIHLAHL